MASHTCLSLCAGSGMFDHGVDAAIGGTLRQVLYVEREAFAVANLAWQMEQGFLAPAAVWSDARTLTSADCRAYLGKILSGRALDFLIGGIPCQPWSQAGRRRGAADGRDLWPAALEAIGAYSPGIVFIENVTGIVKKPMGAERIVSDLESTGYQVVPGIFASEEVGASQERRRVFFLAVEHARCSGLQRHWRSPSAQGAPDRAAQAAWLDAGHALGDADQDVALRPLARAGSGRLGRGPDIQGQGPAQRGGPEQRRKALADTRGFRFSRREECDPQSLPRIDGKHRRDDGRRDLAVARNHSNGLREARQAEPSDAPERTGCGSAGLPYYAPFRDDFASWAVVAEMAPARMPAIESALCRVAHGVAGRPHELRLIGNGVDALAAGYAFTTLWACLQWRLTS